MARRVIKRWDHEEGGMEVHSSGDYVEHDDYVDEVGELQEEIDRLQKLINDVYYIVIGEAK